MAVPEWLRLRRGGVELRIRLNPRSSKNRVVGLYGDRLKIQLTAPPVGGAANEALTAFLARAAGVSRSRVEVVSGAKDRSKTVLVSHEDPEALAARLRETLAPD